MANYMGTCRTNYFRVTDEAAYQKLFSKLIGEDDIHDFTKEDDGVTYHGFGCFGCIGFEDGSGVSSIDDFFDELQKILPDGEAFVFMEGGHEKLRYVIGCVDIVTKDRKEFMDIQTYALQHARKMLRDPEFETELEY